MRVKKCTSRAPHKKKEEEGNKRSRRSHSRDEGGNSTHQSRSHEEVAEIESS